VCAKLLAAANEAGGEDNVTAVLAQIEVVHG
jgi:serine/threonine protein phosphatase PrpC